MMFLLWFICIFTDIMRFPENNAWFYVCPYPCQKFSGGLSIKLNTTKENCCFSTGYDMIHFSFKRQIFNHFPCLHSIKNISLYCKNLGDFGSSLMALTCFPSVGLILVILTSWSWLPRKDNLLIRGKSSQNPHSLARNWTPSSLGMLKFLGQSSKSEFLMFSKWREPWGRFSCFLCRQLSLIFEDLPLHHLPRKKISNTCLALNMWIE